MVRRNERLTKLDVDKNAFVSVIDFVMPRAIISYGDWFSLLIVPSSRRRDATMRLRRASRRYCLRTHMRMIKNPLSV